MAQTHAGLTDGEPDILEERVLTSVNGQSITVQDFETSYVGYLINTGNNDTPRNRYQYLDLLIDASLLADEAEKRNLDGDTLFQVVIERARRRAIGNRFFEKAFLEELPPLSDREVRDAFVKTKQQVVVRHLFYRSLKRRRLHTNA